MALWQTKFILLPKSLVGGYDEVPADLFEIWQDELGKVAPEFELPSDYQASVDGLLPRSKGWHEDMELWGDTKSDDLSIWRDEGKLATIEVRVDVRKLDDSLLERFLALADSWGCVLVERRYQKVCRMDVKTLRALICGHPQSRALKDPHAWLPLLAAEVRKREERGE